MSNWLPQHSRAPTALPISLTLKPPLRASFDQETPLELAGERGIINTSEKASRSNSRLADDCENEVKENILRADRRPAFHRKLSPTSAPAFPHLKRSPHPIPTIPCRFAKANTRFKGPVCLR